jgi:hypothetical protein
LIALADRSSAELTKPMQHHQCPHCGGDITAAIKSIASANGRKGGKTTGKTKARSSEQARKAVMARWAKRKERTND